MQTGLRQTGLRRTLLLLLVLAAVDGLGAAANVYGQALGEPDRGAPGDAMMQAYLARETARLEASLNDDLRSWDSWQARRPGYIAEYRYMLGLPAESERTPLEATVTGTLDGDGYVVEMLHYQSQPGLYVTANLYRPDQAPVDAQHPAVFYVCGHSGRGRNGNKVAFQSHGIWLARHGYVCLIVDTLQLGEIAATHHGTYNLERWWWHSRGYSPAGVEAWNGIRGIDYLLSRADVDPQRIAVTGISGGGAVSFWIAAADERVRVAIPVSGMADLESYVPHRVINGHCDCMFVYNTFQWPWTRIAGLCAPRPLQFVNSDNDPIFPMDANERVSNRLERLYSLFGASDQFETVVSVGGHAYREDIRRAVFGFLNRHLKHDARPVLDSEADIVSEGGSPGPYPIEPEKLRVFPTDADLPRDERNTTIDEHFIPLARPDAPAAGQYAAWREELLAELRRVTFRYFPAEIPAARLVQTTDANTERLETEQGIHVTLRYPNGKPAAGAKVLLVVLGDNDPPADAPWIDSIGEGYSIVLCEPRGVGDTRWTRKNPPNYVERSHALLGRTVDTGRVWDAVASARYLLAAESRPATLHVTGRKGGGIIAAYAAVLEPQVSEVLLIEPPASHMAADAPQLLNVLRVADVPEILGLLAPRPLRIIGGDAAALAPTQAVYSAAGAAQHLHLP